MKIKKSAALAVPKPNQITSNPSATAPATESVTTIDVKLDVGFGNAVYMRGHGGGLTWERGVPLSCVDGKTWRWTAKVKDPLTFKVLLNDQIWAAGNDLTIRPGQKLEVAPSFV